MCISYSLCIEVGQKPEELPCMYTHHPTLQFIYENGAISKPIYFTLLLVLLEQYLGSGKKHLFTQSV